MPDPVSNSNPKPTRTVAASAAEVPEKLRQHYQFPRDFCAVSGFESIAKLEGLIAPDTFPLQSDPANVAKGFEPAHRTFLDTLGLDAKDDHYHSGADAALVIGREVSAGRFPLVSMPVIGGFHVYIFAEDGGKLLFIDPAVPKVILRGLDALPLALENWRANSPAKHKTIHVLTYIRRATTRKAQPANGEASKADLKQGDVSAVGEDG